MVNVLRTFIEGDQKVTEYTKDGVTVSHTVREPNRDEPTTQPPVETMEEKVARLEQLLLEQNLVQMEVLATIFEELVGGA